MLGDCVEHFSFNCKHMTGLKLYIIFIRKENCPSMITISVQVKLINNNKSNVLQFLSFNLILYKSLSIRVNTVCNEVIKF